MGWRFPEEQREFWWGQLLRAITEIVFPIIGSLIWTIIDIKNSGKEMETGHFKSLRTGKDIPGKHHVDSPQFDEKKLFKYDIAGINTCKIAIEWEADLGKILVPLKI